MATRRTNRLAGEKSPYLLQHAENPVDWYPWSAEALERARAEDRPIFLSIGYATCHWCHVMERESFEDPLLAALLNETFVNIKVDREERPDLDRIYMAFVQAISGGSGGWPMSVWLTPELKPFFGGTYFPPTDRGGRPGLGTLVAEIGRAWAERRDEIRRASDSTLQQLRLALASDEPGELLDADVLDAGYHIFDRSFDEQQGGFGGAPKFPRPVVHQLLLRHHLRTGDERAAQMVLGTLRAMARGGIHDHVGGGFHRYSVDARWHVPHFEKMLYDQAQLAQSYLEAYQVSGEAELAATARDIFGYVLRELTDADSGAFYSAEDADSLAADGSGERREGAYYVWTADELRAVLGDEDAGLFADHYGVTPEGNADDPHGELTGTNVLFERTTVEQTAARLGRDAARVATVLERGRLRLRQHRAATRPRPLLDDKIITAWNAMMISALARGAQVLGEPRYLEAATRAAHFVVEHLYGGGRGPLSRRFRAGEAAFEGTLEDHAALLGALVDLHQAGGQLRWLTLAEALADQALARFGDAQRGGFFATSGDDPTVLLRIKDDYDGAEPSGNATMAFNLLRLSAIVGRPDLGEEAARTVRALAGRVRRAPHAMPLMLVAYQLWCEPPPLLVVIGPVDDPRGPQLLAPLYERFAGDALVCWVDQAFIERYGSRPELSPVLAMWQRRASGDAPVLYLCRGQRCELPMDEPSKLRQLMDAERWTSPRVRHSTSSLAGQRGETD